MAFTVRKLRNINPIPNTNLVISVRSDFHPCMISYDSEMKEQNNILGVILWHV